MLQPLRRRCWAPRGQTPQLHQWTRHDRLTAITALTLSPQRRRVEMHLQLLEHNARWDDFVWFLRHLRDQLARELIVIWDGLRAHHKAERVLSELDCSWVQFEYLPPYCPELNPVEHVWSQTKWSDLVNHAPENIEQLRDDVLNSYIDQSLHQRLLLSHFAWAKLNLDNGR
jgi:hypothetical protein